jgi:3-methyladenine DNA glycosylase AlkC
MTMRTNGSPRIPAAPRSIRKGAALKHLLGPEAVECLAHNIALVEPGFPIETFRRTAVDGLEPLRLMQRGDHIAAALRLHLPAVYGHAVEVIVRSLTPVRTETDAFGLAELFYIPHSCFIANYGIDPTDNGGADPFEASMAALHALTTRFTSEFAVRPFLIEQPGRTLAQIMAWTSDPNPHVRRFCSEGTRPRLPWGRRVPALVTDPRLTLPILEALKDDPSLYVRRSVANHLGDIAKDHPETAFELCERWLLEGASGDLERLIRHAIRYPVKRGDARALRIQAVTRSRSLVPPASHR